MHAQVTLHGIRALKVKDGLEFFHKRVLWENTRNSKHKFFFGNAGVAKSLARRQGLYLFDSSLNLA